MSRENEWVAYVDDSKTVKLAVRPHNMTRKVANLPYYCCRNCGLIEMRNAASRKALRAGCKQVVE
jgi:hypothetical protein